MNTIKYFLGVMLLVLATMSLAGAENFDSREFLFDTMITGLAEKDLTDQEKEEIETKIEAWVDDLSDDQVIAFNQSLNNALHTPWSVDFTDPENWELLDLALDNNYNQEQIIVTQGIVERFQRPARLLDQLTPRRPIRRMFRATPPPTLQLDPAFPRCGQTESPRRPSGGPGSHGLKRRAPDPQRQSSVGQAS